MTIWDKPVSWSKLKLALECPRSLQFAVDKVPATDAGPNYYQQLGTWVQYCFEQYFNQDINLNPKGRSLDVMERVVSRVLMSSRWKRAQDETTYPYEKTQTMLEAEILRQAKQGFLLFKTTGLLERKIRSEVKYAAVFRGMRMFCMIDFLIGEGQEFEVYDGKGHAKEDADPRQILYYALALIASGRHVRRAGLIYWNFGLTEVNVSPEAMRQFIDGDLVRGRAVMDSIKHGTAEELEAKPEPAKCGKCGWKSRCPASPYRRKEVLNTAGGEVDFK